MKAVTITAIQQELKHLSQTDLIDICLQLSKFKKENKELVTYLLFESSNTSINKSNSLLLQCTQTAISVLPTQLPPLFIVASQKKHV